MLAAIKKVKFFNTAQGWVAAEPSAIFPASVLFTDDGGRVWTPLADDQIAHWSAVDFADPRTAALAGNRGLRGVVHGSLAGTSPPN